MSNTNPYSLESTFPKMSSTGLDAKIWSNSFQVSSLQKRIAWELKDNPQALKKANEMITEHKKAVIFAKKLLKKRWIKISTESRKLMNEAWLWNNEKTSAISSLKLLMRNSPLAYLITINTENPFKWLQWKEKAIIHFKAQKWPDWIARIWIPNLKKLQNDYTKAKNKWATDAELWLTQALKEAIDLK